MWFWLSVCAHFNCKQFTIHSTHTNAHTLAHMNVTLCGRTSLSWQSVAHRAAATWLLICTHRPHTFVTFLCLDRVCVKHTKAVWGEGGGPWTTSANINIDTHKNRPRRNINIFFFFCVRGFGMFNIHFSSEFVWCVCACACFLCNMVPRTARNSNNLTNKRADRAHWLMANYLFLSECVCVCDVCIAFVVYRCGILLVIGVWGSCEERTRADGVN